MIYISNEDTCSFENDDENCINQTARIEANNRENPYILKDYYCQNYNFQPPKRYNLFYFIRDADGVESEPFNNEHLCDGIYNVRCAENPDAFLCF